MNRGDNVLVYVPYVGRPGGKLRPAVVVQADALNALLRETLVAEITSNLAHAYEAHQVLVDLSDPTHTGTGLLFNSAVRCERLHIVPQVDIKRTIGTMPLPLMEQIDSGLRAALAIP